MRVLKFVFVVALFCGVTSVYANGEQAEPAAAPDQAAVATEAPVVAEVVEEAVVEAPVVVEAVEEAMPAEAPAAEAVEQPVVEEAVPAEETTETPDTDNPGGGQ